MKDGWYHLQLKCRKWRKNMLYPMPKIYNENFFDFLITRGVESKFVMHASKYASFESLQLWSSALLHYAIYKTKSTHDGFNVDIYTSTLNWNYTTRQDWRLVCVVIQNMFNKQKQCTVWDLWTQCLHICREIIRVQHMNITTNWYLAVTHLASI